MAQPGTSPPPAPRDVQLHCSHLRDSWGEAGTVFLTWEDDFEALYPGKQESMLTFLKPVWLCRASAKKLFCESGRMKLEDQGGAGGSQPMPEGSLAADLAILAESS